ncbi:hypothetical protein K9M06_00670 [Candidatus Bipolaricaulota bacterium]|nr:hypothetical protein [Candidatus Bipolaricaulota bacterium]
MPEAVSLFSGSLSSSIATEIAINYCEMDPVIILTFRSPFFRHYDDIKELANRLWPDSQFRSKSIKRETKGIASSEDLDSGDGYCDACKVTLLEVGGEFLARVNADFLVSGDNVFNFEEGELAELDRRAGVEEKVFRPLCSNLPESIAGKEVRVDTKYDNPEDRESLQDLAGKLGIEKEIDYYGAEERCKLTDQNYRGRLEDLAREGGFNINDMRLLDFDKYYKISPDTKVVLGEDSDEKRELHNYFLPRDLRFYLPTCEGPMALVRSEWKKKTDSAVDEIVNLAARITVTRSEIERNVRVPVNYRFENDNETYTIDVLPLVDGELDDFSL